MRCSAIAAALVVLLLGGATHAAARRLAQAAPPSAQPGSDGTTPVAFYGSGFLIEYYGGVVKVLAEAGIITADTPLSGNSGGALASIGIVIGLNAGDLVKMYGVLKLTGNSKAALGSILPDDIATLASGRVSMGISQLDASQTDFNNSAAWVVNEYTSKADVLDAMFATSCLPCFLGNTTYCTFRDQPVLDGAYGVSWEQLCPGGDTGACIKVSAETTTAIHLGLLPGDECPYPTREDPLTQLYQNDVANAAEWPLAESEGRCPEAEWEGQAPWPEPPQFQAWWPTQPDIFPGKYGPLPNLNGTQITACEWESWTRGLPEGLFLEAAEAIYAQGEADAKAWLAERDQAGGST